MIKKSYWILLIILLIPLLVKSYFFIFDRHYESQYFSLTEEHWRRLEINEENQDKAEELLHQLDQKLKLLNNKINFAIPEKTIKIGTTRKPSKEFRSYIVEREIILINEDLYQLGYPPFINLLTRLVTKRNGSLTIGLAAYLQDYYGQNSSFYNFGAPIIPLSKQFVDKLSQRAFEAIGKPSGVVDNELSFTLMSHSYITFLIEQYGEKVFLQLYNDYQINDELDQLYNQYYNKSLSQLKKDWLLYLSSQPDFKYDWEDWVLQKLKINTLDRNQMF